MGPVQIGGARPDLRLVEMDVRIDKPGPDLAAIEIDAVLRAPSRGEFGDLSAGDAQIETRKAFRVDRGRRRRPHEEADRDARIAQPERGQGGQVKPGHPQSLSLVSLGRTGVTHAKVACKSRTGLARDVHLLRPINELLSPAHDAAAAVDTRPSRDPRRRGGARDRRRRRKDRRNGPQRRHAGDARGVRFLTPAIMSCYRD